MKVRVHGIGPHKSGRRALIDLVDAAILRRGEEIRVIGRVRRRDCSDGGPLISDQVEPPWVYLGPGLYTRNLGSAWAYTITGDGVQPWHGDAVAETLREDWEIISVDAWMERIGEPINEGKDDLIAWAMLEEKLCRTRQPGGGFRAWFPVGSEAGWAMVEADKKTPSRGGSLLFALHFAETHQDTIWSDAEAEILQGIEAEARRSAPEGAEVALIEIGAAGVNGCKISWLTQGGELLCEIERPTLAQSCESMKEAQNVPGP